MADLVAIAKDHLEALAKGDWSTYRNGLTDNAVYDEEATQRRVQGADDYIKRIKEWKSAFPDMKATVKEAIAARDAVVLEVEWQGTHKGAFTGPMGSIPATGRQGKLPAMVLFRFEGEKIRETHHYFDLMTMLRDLGVMPQPQAAPPK